MKKYFVTGLVILLPLALTLIIAQFFVDLLTDPFVGLVQSLFDKYGIFAKGFLFLTSDQVQILIGKIIILFVIFTIIICLGFVGRWFLFHYFLGIWDGIIHRIPFVNTVYKTSQDIVSTIFTADKGSFKKVVLVPYPHKDAFCVALVTNDNLPDLLKTGSEQLISVYIPTTPNPTSGFVVLFKPQDIIPIDVKVEDAFKFIISCGVIEPPSFKKDKELLP